MSRTKSNRNPLIFSVLLSVVLLILVYCLYHGILSSHGPGDKSDHSNQKPHLSVPSPNTGNAPRPKSPLLVSRYP